MEVFSSQDAKSQTEIEFTICFRVGFLGFLVSVAGIELMSSRDFAEMGNRLSYWVGNRCLSSMLGDLNLQYHQATRVVGSLGFIRRVKPRESIGQPCSLAYCLAFVVPSVKSLSWGCATCTVMLMWKEAPFQKSAAESLLWMAVWMY